MNEFDWQFAKQASDRQIVMGSFAKLGKSDSYCYQKSYQNRDVSTVPLLHWKRIDLFLKLKLISS